jgi:hypothetical protein
MEGTRYPKFMGHLFQKGTLLLNAPILINRGTKFKQNMSKYIKGPRINNLGPKSNKTNSII